MAVNCICSASEWGSPSYAGKGSEAARDAYYAGYYTTVAAWESSISNTFTEDQAAEIIGLTADNSTIYFDGPNTTSGYKAILKAAEGQEADGSDAAGAQIDTQVSLYESTGIVNIDIQGVEFHTVGSIGVYLDNADSVVNITKCVFRDTGVALNINSCAAIEINIGVCLFRNIVGLYKDAIKLNDPDVTNCKVVNCSFYDCYSGLSELAGSYAAIKNCVSLDNNGGDDFYYSPSNISYCCSSDTTATGTGSLTSKTSANNWTDAAADDFTIKDTSADIYQSGTPISGESWFPSTDLAGNAWATPPSMGCFEYVSAILPILLPETCTASEAISIQVGAAVSDAGAGADNFGGMDAAVPVSDSGSGADDVAPAISLAVSDTAAAVDVISQVLSSLSIPDAGSALDAVAQIIASMAVADVGAGVDGVDVSVLGEIIKTVSDVGVGMDAIGAPVVSLSLSDSAAGSDLIASISSALSIQDTVSASDLINTIKTQLVQISDSGQGDDAVSMSVSLTVSDVATAADTIGQVLAALNITDGGAGTDTAIATNFDLLPHGKVRITFSMKIPGVSFSMKKPGVEPIN